MSMRGQRFLKIAAATPSAATDAAPIVGAAYDPNAVAAYREREVRAAVSIALLCGGSFVLGMVCVIPFASQTPIAAHARMRARPRRSRAAATTAFPRSWAASVGKKRRPRLVHVLCAKPEDYRWLVRSVRGATLTDDGFLVADEAQWATYLQAAGGKEI